MRYAITNHALVEQSNRCDAQYFDQKYNFLNRLDDIKSGPIDCQAYVSDGNHLTIAGDYLEEGGVRYLRGQDISTAMIVEDRTAVFIPEENYNKLKRSHIFENDVLVTIVGANTGCVGFVYNPPEKLTANCKLGIIRAHEKRLAPFIYSFLISRYGQAQIERSIRGGGQTGLILPDLRAIKVPNFSIDLNNILSNIILKSHEIRSDMQTIYQKAQNVLLSELGLIAWKPKHTLSYVRQFSNVNKSKRIDAEYFQPKYDEVLDAVKNYEHGYDQIQNLFTQNKGNAKLNDGDTYRYVEISSVNTTSGELAPLVVVGKELPANAKRQLQKDDVIISKVRTYRGAVSIIPEVGLIGSSAFTALHATEKINKETLFAFFKMPAILDLSLKYNSGTSYPVIKDEDILNLPFPLIPQILQKEIACHINEVSKEQKRSYILLDIAKHGVEKAIDDGESVAEAWIIEKLGKLGIKLDGWG